MNIAAMTLPQIFQLLENSHCEVNFWGVRHIYLSENKGSIKLSEITERFFALGDDCLQTNYSIENRKIGHCIREQLLDFYKSTNEQLKSINIITHIFYTIRCWLGLNREEQHKVYPEVRDYKSNYYDRLCGYEFFQGFTSKQYKEHFLFLGIIPKPSILTHSYRTSIKIGPEQIYHFYAIPAIGNGKFCIY